MKNLIIIIGTIILGTLIVSNFILKDDGNSLYSAAEHIANHGSQAITNQFDKEIGKYITKE